MMTAEFDLIARYFTRPVQRAVLGVGDDCALLQAAEGKAFAVSTDTLVAGTHFFADTDAEKLGHKALAVNLSDLAAMAAMPRYALLALTLPRVEEAWVSAFSQGFFALADRYAIELIGGDTTRGPLSITITVFGEVAADKALRRDRAQLGDDVWVSGTLGGAALGLKYLQRECTVLPEAVIAEVLQALHCPQPRIELGMTLPSYAHAAIDISDGLLADLGHICRRSNLSAVLDYHALPLAAGLMDIPIEIRDQCVMAGGDDYELCFTASVSRRMEILQQAALASTPVTRIGTMIVSNNAKHAVSVYSKAGDDVTPVRHGFDHFEKERT